MLAHTNGYRHAATYMLSVVVRTIISNAPRMSDGGRKGNANSNLQILSRSVWKLLACNGRASVASAINANICTGFTVILAIQHSHIFVVETSKMCRRNVRPVSAKRLSINGLSSKRLYSVETTHEGHLMVFITVQNLVGIDTVVLIVYTFSNSRVWLEKAYSHPKWGAM